MNNKENNDENLSNGSLLEAIRRGDRKAFSELYLKYFPAFKTYVMSNSGNEQDARDVFQEAMYTAWLKVRSNQYVDRGDAKFSTFVYEVAKRKWWNHSRSSYVNKTVHTESSEFPQDIMDADPAQEKLEEQIDLLQKLIGELGPNCQEILKQFYFEKASYEEMATSLEKTPQTLKNQKFRCMNRLREKYLNELKTSAF